MNYFGIDVHSTYHKVVGLTADGEPLEFDIPNTREGREELQELMLQHKPCAVAMEACSGAYKIYDLLRVLSANAPSCRAPLGLGSPHQNQGSTGHAAEIRPGTIHPHTIKVKREARRVA